MDLNLKCKLVSLCARRGSGKSEMIKAILRKYKKEFEEVFLICPTECLNNAYVKEELIKDNRVLYEYKDDWVEKLLKAITEINKGKTKEDGKHFLLILDDCFSDVNLHSSKNNKQLKVLATRGRHLCLSVIIATQSYKMLPPVIRNNCDYLFIGKLSRNDFDNLAQGQRIGLDKNKFVDLLEKNTNDYRFVFLDCCANDDKKAYYTIKLKL